MAMQSPPEWYGQLREDIGSLTSGQNAIWTDIAGLKADTSYLMSQHSRLVAQFEAHLAHYNTDPPANSANSRGRQVAIIAGKYAGIPALIYVLIDLLRGFLGV